MEHSGISIVIPSRGRLRLLENLLRTLAAERAALGAPSEVIVADSSPASLVPAMNELCGAYAARYLRSRSRNPAVSRNAGAGAARHAVVLFIDSDCEARPGLLLSHLNAYCGAKTGGVAGITEFTGESGPGYMMMERTPYLRPFSFQASKEKVSWAPSSNVSYRRDVLEALGGFPESLPIDAGGEDVLLGWKVTGAGYDIVCSPGAVAGHNKETWNSIAAALRRAVKWGRADCHIVISDAVRTRWDLHLPGLFFLLSIPSAMILALVSGPAWLLLPAACAAAAVIRKALAGTPALNGPAPLYFRAGGALLMLAFEVSYLLECLRCLRPEFFKAPAHEE